MGRGALHHKLHDLLRVPEQTRRRSNFAMGGPMALRIFLIAGVAVLTLYAGRAAADICADPNDQTAVRTKTLQTELMVAALRCDSSHRYNAFVRKFERDLVAQGTQLKSYFKRVYGADSKRRINRFVTFLANSASLRSLDAGDKYCDGENALFTEVLSRDAGGLAKFAANYRVDVASTTPVCARVAALIER